VGPHPHALPALAALAAVFTDNEPLGVAICPNTPPQNADPSGLELLTSGAERSEALAAVGVGPRESN